MKLKILFAGTPNFSVPALKSLIDNHQVLAVLTQPDRPSGRGRKLKKSPVKECALLNKIIVLQPDTLKTTDIQQTLKAFDADLMVVVAYGIILPLEILTIPKYGCVNIHASILPRWRGAAPIHRAILNNDAQTGISIMKMDAGLDTGDIIKIITLKINQNETTEKLHDRLSVLGATAMIDVLQTIDTWQPQPQNDKKSNYAKKITKTEAIIDWQQSAALIHNKIRAFNNWPVAQSKINNTIIRIWQANKNTDRVSFEAGTVFALNKNFLSVATKDGSIHITKLQMPSKNPMIITDFFNANRLIKVGDCFE